MVAVRKYFVVALLILACHAKFAYSSNVRPFVSIATRRIKEFEGDSLERIYGGTPAQPSAYASLGQNTLDRDICTGTLVHEDLILTTAHCQGRYFGGDVIIGSNERLQGGERIAVAKEIPHPKFNDPFNDIMLVKLESPSSAPLVVWNEDPDVVVPGATMTVVGFGETGEGNSDTLLAVDVDIRYDQNCSDAFDVLEVWDPTMMICAGGSPEGGVGPCEGDSGGPLYSQSGIQVGMYSFGEDDDCAVPNIPDVYTKLSAYADWIKTGICLNAANPPIRCISASPSMIPSDAPIAPSTFPSHAPVWTPTFSPTLAPVTQTSSPTTDPTPVPCPCGRLQLLCRLLNRCLIGFPRDE